MRTVWSSCVSSVGSARAGTVGQLLIWLSSLRTFGGSGVRVGATRLLPTLHLRLASLRREVRAHACHI